MAHYDYSPDFLMWRYKVRGAPPQRQAPANKII
jgi:hypothetical protein